MVKKDISTDIIDIIIESIKDEKLKEILYALNKSIKRDNNYIADIIQRLKTLEKTNSQ